MLGRLALMSLILAASAVEAGKVRLVTENGDSFVSSAGTDYSTVQKNPADIAFADGDFYKFTLGHGACDYLPADCSNDRQRLELKDGKRLKLKSFNGPKRVKVFYRTNMFLPAEKDLPDLTPISQMIHQVKYKNLAHPIWMVHLKNGGLTVRTFSNEACGIDSKHLPRGEWLEIEIFANYSVFDEKDYQSMEPSLSYRINGKVHCEFFSPLITNDLLREFSDARLTLKFGMYHTFVSRWLLKQPENIKWVADNKLTFDPYVQKSVADSKAKGRGMVSSNLANPFDYDWPIKLPEQTIYFSDWFVASRLDDLPDSRYDRQESDSKESHAPPSVLDYGASTTEVCGRALVEWGSEPGAWSAAAEARGLSAESCKLFLK